MITISERVFSSSTPVKWDCPKRFGGGCNKVIIETHDGFKSIFKPVSGERKGLRRGTLRDDVPYYVREALAYDLDKLFGFGIVPVTVVGKLGRRIGSRQLWVDGETRYGYSRSDFPKCDSDIDKMIIFDYITGNTDRHSANMIYDIKKKKLWAIDHGLCFPVNMDQWSPCFLDWQETRNAMEGDASSIAFYFQRLPKSVVEQMRKISKRRFLARFRKYKMGLEGKDCWERLQKLLAA